MQEALTILVADDIASNRLVLRHLLVRAGHRVVEAGDGPQALDIIHCQHIDIALLDIMMPVIDGYDLCRRIRERFSPTQLPILFITAKVADEDLAAGFAAGGNDYIHKPINPTILRARLSAQVSVLRMTRALEQTHAELAKKKRLETIGVFAAGVAHNFNNILGTVLGSAELIQLFTAPESDAHEAADLILAAGKRGAALVENLLSFARPADQQTCSDPNAIIKSVFSLLPTVSGNRLSFEIQVPEDLPPLSIAPEDFAQLLLELLKNGVEAMKKEGVLVFSAEQNPDPSSERPMVVFTIKDTGPGMPHHIVEHLFEPFFSTKNLDTNVGIALDGSGLGLCAAYNLASAAGGSIELVETGPQGTTLIVRIPIVSAA